MSLFLAIDAGGTKTQCALADDERVLARAQTGTVKLMRVAEAEATARMEAMLAEVAAAAGVSLGSVTRTCMGLAGFTSEAARAWARRVIGANVGGELILVGDEEIALDAAFQGGPGILVIAGTGAIAMGRAGSGQLFTAGGFGPVLGDEGSGYWIGLEAIRAALRAQDRLPLMHDEAAHEWGTRGVSTCLLREIERHWGLGSTSELIAMGNQRSPSPDFAALAPVVARCAEAGDVLAAGILERAGEELAELVGLVFQKMGTGSAAEVGVAFTGSVLGRIGAVRAAMVARLAVSVPRARVREAAVDALDGALWRARAPGAVLGASREGKQI
jgi:N-acetylglucosamine kinase-like BadF-type ATPase